MTGQQPSVQIMAKARQSCASIPWCVASWPRASVSKCSTDHPSSDLNSPYPGFVHWHLQGRAQTRYSVSECCHPSARAETSMAMMPFSAAQEWRGCSWVSTATQASCIQRGALATDAFERGWDQQQSIVRSKRQLAPALSSAEECV